MEEHPLMLFTRNFLLTYWKKRGKEKRENGEEKKENGKNGKKEGGKSKMEGEKSMKMIRGPFFFTLSLFTFLKPLKFV